jgi:hypothetical protein
MGSTGALACCFRRPRRKHSAVASGFPPDNVPKVSQIGERRL